MLEELRREVCEMNAEIFKQRLAAMTSGNVSGRDPSTGYVVIKPSGVNYERLTPSHMVVLDLDGNIVEGDMQPSVDTETHLVIYRNMPGVGGVTHTHSPYATSFAALGQPIPVYLTTLAHVFGGPVPVGEYTKIGTDESGLEIVRSIGKSPAILMKRHGVFTVGPTATEALKVASMLEEAAMTVHLALLRGQPAEIDAEEVERCYRYYHEAYGQ